MKIKQNDEDCVQSIVKSLRARPGNVDHSFLVQLSLEWGGMDNVAKAVEAMEKETDDELGRLEQLQHQSTQRLDNPVGCVWLV